MSNVHGYRPDPTSNVAIVTAHEELVQIRVLTGLQGGPRRGRNAAKGRPSERDPVPSPAGELPLGAGLTPRCR